MHKSRKILGLIPARAGSKGLAGKNLAPLAGKPLLAWTVEAARASKYIDSVVLTSEDDAIISAAASLGCATPFKRPAALAQDDSTAVDVALHALQQLPGFDLVVLLQPTSPLRAVADIDGAIELMLEKKGQSCVSVSQVHEHPFWMYSVGEAGTLRPLLPDNTAYARRQLLPPVYALNGAVYVSEVPRLQKTKAFTDADTLAWIMPPERAVDIDTALDLQWAAFLLARTT